MMNRRMRRLSDRNGARMQKKEWNHFVNVTNKHILVNNKDEKQNHFDEIWQNNKYIVFITRGVKRNGNTYTRLMCRRSDSKPIYNWQDLYRIKNELCGAEVEAIQIMPKVSELTDVANLYWFFVLEGERLAPY